MSFVSRAIYQNNLFSIKNWVKILVDFSISKNLEKYPIYFGLRVKHWRFIGIHILFKTQFEQEKDIHTLCNFRLLKRPELFRLKNHFWKFYFWFFLNDWCECLWNPHKKFWSKHWRNFLGKVEASFKNSVFGFGTNNWVLKNILTGAAFLSDSEIKAIGGIKFQK